MDIHELAENQDDDPQKLAEIAIGMALDNGHDMANTDPEQHLANEWKGYVRTVTDMYVESVNELDNGIEYAILDFENLEQRILEAVPTVANEKGLSLEE